MNRVIGLFAPFSQHKIETVPGDMYRGVPVNPVKLYRPSATNLLSFISPANPKSLWERLNFDNENGIKRL